MIGFRIAHGCNPDELFIAIPHQRPPFLVSSRECPPEEGDTDFDGDHDLHTHILATDGHLWRGHQRFAVQRLANLAMKEAEAWEK